MHPRTTLLLLVLLTKWLVFECGTFWESVQLCKTSANFSEAVVKGIVLVTVILILQ